MGSNKHCMRVAKGANFKTVPVAVDPAGVQVQHVRWNLVEEISVVGHDQDGAGPGLEVSLEPDDRLRMKHLINSFFLLNLSY